MKYDSTDGVKHDASLLAPTVNYGRCQGIKILRRGGTYSVTPCIFDISSILNIKLNYGILWHFDKPIEDGGC